MIRVLKNISYIDTLDLPISEGFLKEDSFYVKILCNVVFDVDSIKYYG